MGSTAFPAVAFLVMMLCSLCLMGAGVLKEKFLPCLWSNLEDPEKMNAICSFKNVAITCEGTKDCDSQEYEDSASPPIP